MAGRRTSVYLSGPAADALKASGRQLAEVIATGLGIEPEPTEATLRRVIREELAALAPAAGDDTRSRPRAGRRQPARSRGSDGESPARDAGPRAAGPAPSLLSPVSPPQACKHARATKGWCKDCQTGGHF